MNVVGIIAEYNPFHHGHLYQIHQVKKIVNPDIILCIMSGNFVQRGEPAIFDKWARTRMALSAGIDLVIELPTCFCTATAEIFAQSAINILKSIGIVNILSFGVENCCKKELLVLGGILAEEPPMFKDLIKIKLKKGISFAAAREEALIEYLLHYHNFDTKRLSNLLKQPNFILGLEYVKAINKVKANVEILPIQRYGASYHNISSNVEFPSATAIRELLKKIQVGKKSLSSIIGKIPDNSYSIIKNEIDSGKGPIFMEDFESLLLYILRRTSALNLKSFFDVVEGLENRIKRASKVSTSLQELIDGIKSKRYPETKIKRILIHILININKELVFLRKPLYLRVLGANQRGTKLLKKITKDIDIPIITRTAMYKNLDSIAKSMFEIDLSASDIYSLAYPLKSSRKSGLDFKQNIIFYNFER